MTLTRRSLFLTALAAPALMAAPLRAQVAGPRANISSFQMQDWRDHFDSIGKGAILADLTSRALHYWGADGTYRLYPSSIPLTEALTRRGHTEIVRKRTDPDWRPTADMLRRDPSLPRYVPPGPECPLGTRAMYLSWPAYIIHGTHDTRKIGRPSSSGCVGLYNEHVEELYEMAPVGTQVLLL
ncbi:L,D-transpeptidase [Falsirhodobacter algicola]|uniref:L,D-transpeptidase family protein n=1 Tax=Falsirhodobacter algicola TaxID=2692330 RepID=A0A8J8MTP3_9RHOB|nr:L,D-transpeptidase [Falsirhodobacter algicola]QUS36216.1 L,D-transpeptidase family protein [Falsirhodobacter algicola]